MSNESALAKIDRLIACMTRMIGHAPEPKRVKGLVKVRKLLQARRKELV